jgi:ubiquinone biosynthesis protein
VLADCLRDHGAAEFCERVLCEQDFLVSRTFGQHLERSDTLAGGAERCDFRWQPGTSRPPPPDDR